MDIELLRREVVKHCKAGGVNIVGAKREGRYIIRFSVEDLSGNFYELLVAEAPISTQLLLLQRKKFLSFNHILIDPGEIRFQEKEKYLILKYKTHKKTLKDLIEAPGEINLLDVFFEILSLLKFLHSNFFCLVSLEADRIYVDNNHPIFSDFTYAKELFDGDTISQKFPLEFSVLSPELIRRDKTGFSSDIFVFGLLICQAFYPDVFAYFKSAKYFDDSCTGHLGVTFPEVSPITELLDQIFVSDPLGRISLNDIFNSKVFLPYT